ncbi:MAG: type II toxin-antitoxin system YoeB family toxin [Pseudomonadota bacterium]
MVISWSLSTPRLVYAINTRHDLTQSFFEGIGKPEVLKENLAGFWSRRIDESYHLVYTVGMDCLTIISCG